jgi:hypothetical protein
LFTVEGAFDGKGKKLAFEIKSDSKIRVGKPDANFVAPTDYQKWILFMKCMRGDGGDNVFSAYPGVRVKGTKNNVGLTEAFADRDKKGYSWNNMMLQRWTDHEGVEHRVLDDYQRNVQLCDLTAQPENIKLIINDTINNATTADKSIPQVGIRLLKFCAEFDLQKISEQVQSYAEPLNAKYSA